MNTKHRRGPSSRRLFGATLAVVACGVAVACGDPSSAPEPVPASVSVSPDRATFTAIDETVQFSAQVRDQNGDVMTGVAVSWTSSDADVVSVDASTGLATAVAAGDAVVTARAGPARGNARAAVRQEARAMEKAEGDGQQGFAGEALPVPIAVLVSDANGHPASNITVTFRVASGGGSVSPAFERTAADGIARATWTLGIDSAQLASASAGDLTATFHATAAPERLAVVTDSLKQGRVTLAYGDTLAARGGSREGYTWSLVRGSSLPAGLALDPEGAIHGTPAETGFSGFDVQVVDSDGGTAEQRLHLRVCDGPLGLETGEVRVMNAPEIQPCGFFVRAPEAGAYYRVVIVGTSGTGERILPVELAVEGVAAAESDRRPEPERQAADQRPGAATRLDQPRAGEPRNGLDIMLANDRFHRRIREQEAELFDRWAAEGRLAGILERGPGVSVARAPVVQPQTSPSRRTFRVARRDVADPWNRCEVDLTVNAKLLAEDEHLAVYEDETTTSPVSLDNVRTVIDYYADHGAEVIDRYFGGVSDVNGDGRVVVLINPLLTETGWQGYVTSNDMLVSTADCAVSNEMEIVYMSANAFNSLDEDQHWVLGLMVHEVKHVSSLYKRVRGWYHRGADPGDRRFHQVWIEEGRAEIATEMSSRLAWERAGGPSATARLDGEMLRDGRQSAFAEFYGVSGVAAGTVFAFSVDPNAVTFEPFDLGYVYGSGWHFHRFLRDWFAGAGSSLADDAAFVSALNDSTARSGIAGLTDHMGESFADLLTSHAVAVAVAGAEASLVSTETPRFTSFDFPTAAEIFVSPDPPGRYPWPVTLTGADDASAVAAAALARTSTYRGEIGESGFRIHDFRAQTAYDGAVFHVSLPLWARVIVARIPEPEPLPR